MAKSLAIREKYQNFTALMERQRPNLQAVLPPGWDVERMIASIRLAAIRESKLLDCTKESLVRASIEAARLGLDPSGVGGYAYMIPFRNHGKLEAQLIPGYRGLIRAAYRAGVAKNIRAEVVYSGDVFEEVLGSEPKLVHVPLRMGDRGEPVAVYAIAYTDGDAPPLWVTMSIDEVKSIEARSKARSFSPWKTDWTEMAKKTAIRRLCKLLPGGDELDSMLYLDDKAYNGGPSVVTVMDHQALAAGAEAAELAAEAAAEEKKSKRLAKKLKGEEEAAPTEDAAPVEYEEIPPEPTEEDVSTMEEAGLFQGEETDR